MTDEKDFTINVNGADYKVSDLEQEEQLMVAQLQDLDNQINQTNFRADQLNAAKSAFSEKLIASLANKNSEETSEPESEETEESSE